MLLYTGSLLLFIWHFDSLCKIGSFAILLRFVQITYLMMNYELSWQGTHKGIYQHTDGVLDYYDTSIYEINFFPVFQALSPLMPFFFFPDFPETAASSCTGYFNSETGSSDAVFFYSWIIPVVVFGWQVLKWIILYGRSYGAAFNPFERWRVSQALVKYEEKQDEQKNSLRQGQKIKKVVSGQKELEKLLGLLVGGSLCLMPFFLRKGLRVLTCDEEDLGVACTPQTKLTMLAMCLLILGLVGTGIIFLEDNNKDGPYKFLTKSKKSTMKKWDFYTHTRMLLVVVTTFISSNGVFQAGFALTCLLLNMVVHAFSNPYKHPRCNDLEKLAFLSNISMLFLGMVGSIGALPNELSAYCIQLFGMFLFAFSFMWGFYIVGVESFDRWLLNRTKQGLPHTNFKQFLYQKLPHWLTMCFIKKDPIAERSVNEDSLVEFVGQLMDALLPKQRDGSDPFTKLARGKTAADKEVPKKEIEKLLFSHAVTKKEMFKIREAAYYQWLSLTTKLIYMTVFDPTKTGDPHLREDFGKEEAVLRLKTCIRRLAKPEPKNWLLRVLYRIWYSDEGKLRHSHSATDYLKGDTQGEDQKKRLKYVWAFMFHSNLVKDFERDEDQKSSRVRALHRYAAIWERVVGDTCETSGVAQEDSIDKNKNEKEEKDRIKRSRWFHWEGEGIEREFKDLYALPIQGTNKIDAKFSTSVKLKLPTREQVMLDWYFDSFSDLTLVDSLQKATMMLGNEYQSMIRTTKSSIIKCKEVLSLTRAKRDAGAIPAVLKIPLRKWDNEQHQEVDDGSLLLDGVTACFGGDILCFQLHLQNCFGQDIPNPSKRVHWVVKLRPIECTGESEKGMGMIKRAIEHLKPKVTDVEVLAAKEDLDDDKMCILEFAIPSTLKQMAYRVDIFDYYDKLNYKGQQALGKVKNAHGELRLINPDPNFDLRVGESVEILVSGRMDELKEERMSLVPEEEEKMEEGKVALYDTSLGNASENGLKYFQQFLVIGKDRDDQNNEYYILDRCYYHDEYKKDEKELKKYQELYGKLPCCNSKETAEAQQEEDDLYVEIRKINSLSNIIYVQNPIDPNGSLRPLWCYGRKHNIFFSYPEHVLQEEILIGHIHFENQHYPAPLFLHGALLRVELWYCVDKSEEEHLVLKREHWDVCGIIQFELKEVRKEGAEQNEPGTEIMVKELQNAEYDAIQNKNLDSMKEAMVGAGKDEGDDENEVKEDADEAEETKTPENQLSPTGNTGRDQEDGEKKHIQKDCGIEMFEVAMKKKADTKRALSSTSIGDEEKEEGKDEVNDESKNSKKEDGSFKGTEIEVRFQISGDKKYEITKYKVKAYVMGIGQDHATMPVKQDCHGKNGFIWCLDADGSLYQGKDKKALLEDYQVKKKELDSLSMPVEDEDGEDEDGLLDENINMT